MAETEHGTRLGVTRHHAAGESLCPPCADFYNDRQRADRVRNGKAKEARVSALALGRILRGWSPDRALEGEVGPQLRDALIAKAVEHDG
jgi:hypothetical protein